MTDESAVAGLSPAPLALAPLAFRAIALDRDRALVAAWARETFAISFGDEWTSQHFDTAGFLEFVRWGVDAFPDGCVLACMALGERASPFGPSEDRPVGMLLLDVREAASAGSTDIAGPIAYAHLYYLEPAVRGTGASDALQVYADEFCRRHQAQAIELNVEPSNVRAARYYARMGYQVVRGTLRDGIPLLRMRKTFTPLADDPA